MRLLRSRSGQFVPLTTMILFTAVLLMVAGMNIYRITKAKLQTQNLTDAAALAVAAMEAKAVNTIVDRNEWLNHMYGPGYKPNGDSLPNISQANGAARKTAIAQPYANLVATINKAQWMFKAAYDNFLGANQNTGSNGSGNIALGDILTEIDGLQDPTITGIWVYNNQTNIPSDQMTSDPNQQKLTMDVAGKLHNGMVPLKFKTVDVNIKLTDGKKNRQTLTQLAGASGQNDETKVGWVRPVWDDPSNTLQVQVAQGTTEGHWGVGVTVVKQVPLFMFGVKQVQATSMAYVVDSAGLVTASGSKDLPPAAFKPTYFARLAYRP